MRNPSPLLAAAGAAAALVFAVLFWRERTAARSQAGALAEAQARIAVLEGELDLGKVKDTGGPAPARDAVAAPLPPPAGREGERGRPPGRGRRMEAWAELLNDPAIAPLLQKQRSRQVATRYAALFAKLGLSEEQAAKLQALLADKQLSRTEAQALARQQGLDRGEARDVARQADAESDAAIRALVGDAAFAQLQDFDRTMPQRSAVNGLATQLLASDAPLSAAQQERLVATLAAHAAGDPTSALPMMAEGLGHPGGNFVAGFQFRGQSSEQVQALIDRKAAGDAAVLGEAAQFLSAAQVAALRRQQEEQAEQLLLAAKLGEVMRRERTSE